MRRRALLSVAIAIALGFLWPLGYVSNAVSAKRCENATARVHAPVRSPLTCPLVYTGPCSDGRDLYAQAYSMAISKRVGMPTVAQTPGSSLVPPWAEICRARPRGPYIMEVSYGWCAAPLVGGGGKRTFLCIFGLVFKLSDKTTWVT